MSRIVKLVIDKEEIEIDLEEELQIFDVGEDQTKVAAQMAYWGSVWASAKSEAVRIDALYRGWRAKMAKGQLENNPKMSDTKIKYLIEADGRFKSLKDAIAEAEKNIVSSHAIFESFRSKAAVLSSKGAMDRAIFERTGMVTKSSKPKKKKKKVETDKDKEKLKGIFKKEKKEEKKI